MLLNAPQPLHAHLVGKIGSPAADAELPLIRGTFPASTRIPVTPSTTESMAPAPSSSRPAALQRQLLMEPLGILRDIRKDENVHQGIEGSNILDETSAVHARSPRQIGPGLLS